MTKPEAEKIVRALCHDWRREQGEPAPALLDFSAFRPWLLARRPDALDFRSRGGAARDAERWFDDEMRQAWRQ